MEPTLPEPHERLIPTSIRDEMEASYLAYAMSVIIGRALPDVRDGLKPVHRRVLYAMNEQRNDHAHPPKKSARIVGDVIGKYHPHGDLAVYDTIVRLAQTFSLRYPLIDGQGNFGSIDGDAPAAMRYTEIRLKPIAQAMLGDIDKDTVDFIPNYDGQDVEPTVLPARLPNLLVNGSSGIAVGMATNIPPHDLGEIVRACITCIRNPSTTVDDLFSIVTGPDFPTAAQIIGIAGVRQAYRTGRGRVVLRAVTEIEVAEKTERQSIIVRELPYQVNKAQLVEYIAELVRDKKLQGISDLRDESDRDGMRIVIELKKNEIAQVVLNNLYKHTALQSSFGVNMVAIVDGQPRTLGLRQCIQYFLEFRREVVRRRTEYELREARKREHVLLGYKIALDHLDEVIALIRRSGSPQEAKTGLMAQFGMSDIQAQAVLDLRLQKLTSLEREKILEELKEVQALIVRLETILGSAALIDDLIVAELEELEREHGDARRTRIQPDESEFDKAELIADDEMVITVSHRGYIKRSPMTEYRAQKRGGKGRMGMVTRDEDFVEHVFAATAHDSLLVFTSSGKVLALPVWDLPEAGPAAKGTNIANLLAIPEGEKVRSLVRVRRDWLAQADRFLIFATRSGYVKRSPLDAYQNIRQGGIIATVIEPGDELIGVRLTHGNAHVLIATRNGQAIRFPEAKARAMGRAARGVRGIRLRKDDVVVDMACFDDESKQVLTLSELGYGKRTPLDDYRITHRGGMGIRNFNITAKTGPVTGVKAALPEDEVMIMSVGGKIIRSSVGEIRETGRSASGVRALQVDEGDRIAGFIVLDARDPSEGGNGNGRDAGGPGFADDDEGGSVIPGNFGGGEDE
jgi:DNA gyrase subunit A